jgi:HlyD family secretion protein
MAKTVELTAEALDFAPGLLAIQESPPARLPRVVMYSVAALLGILLIWAVFGKLDIIASAEGRLVPQTYVKIVQPSDAGIVEDILVKEGEKVSAGQVLMRMDMKLAQADRTSLESDLALKALQLRRIDAELTGRNFAVKADAPEELFQKVYAQYIDRSQAYQDGLAQARDALKKAQREYDAARQVLEKLREVTPIVKQQADAYEDLGKRGFAPQVMVRDKRREYLEKTRDLQAQEATVESLQAAVGAAAKQVSQITSKYRSDLQNERVEAEGQYRKLRQESVKQEHRVELLELKAPQAGTVKDLATHTIGTVVSPGTVLLSLVPENEPLVAEVTVKNDDVGFVTPGQRVKVKLVPYPFEKYGMLDGEVVHVGPDATATDSQPQSKDAVNKDRPVAPPGYKALVALNTQALRTQGESLKLVAGMQVIAEINQGQRTVMEYLLSPVQKTVHDSGRER